MLAAATSFFARTAISQSYNIATGAPGSRTGTPNAYASSSTSSSQVEFIAPVIVGLWKVQSATHKVTNKRVSVWSFDKRGPDMDRLGPLAKERTLEVLKAEVIYLSHSMIIRSLTCRHLQASALGRLRHPSILGVFRVLLSSMHRPIQDIKKWSSPWKKHGAN
jgi:SCY1-like protein 2